MNIKVVQGLLHAGGAIFNDPDNAAMTSHNTQIKPSDNGLANRLLIRYNQQSMLNYGKTDKMNGSFDGLFFSQWL